MGMPGSPSTRILLLAQRLQALQDEIAEILPKRDGEIVSTHEFEDFRDRLQALKSTVGKPQSAGSRN